MDGTDPGAGEQANVGSTMQNCENCQLFHYAREATRRTHYRMGWCALLNEPIFWVRSARRSGKPAIEQPS